MRAQVASAPHDLAPALALARAYIDGARSSGDPRPLGRAEAVLAPFGASTASAALWVLRATISQARHDFARALDEVHQALVLDPGSAQAWLTQAAVLTTQGRFREVEASCAALDGLVPPFVPIACRANVRGLTGHLRESLAALQRAHESARAPSEHAWLESIACELRYWSLELEEAGIACQRALAWDASDRYTRALYADVLLEQGECRRVLSLTAESQNDDATAESQNDDALLLRRALAARCLGTRDAEALYARLQRGFARSRRRGDRLHQREEVRLLLAFGREPQRALRLAREGFARQRELWDARLVLEAASSTHDAAAAAPALTWLREAQVESAALTPLSAQLEASR